MKILTTLLLIIYYSNCWCLKKVFKVNSNVSAIDYSPDGTMIAVGGDDSIVRIFDSTYYNSISTYSNGQPIYSLKFSPNNLMLAIGYSNGAKVLNVPGLQLNATIGVSTIVYSVDFSINSTYLSTCGTSSNQLLVFETVGWSQVGNSQNTQGNMHFRKCQFTKDNYIILLNNGNTGYLGTIATNYISPAYTIPNITNFTSTGILTCLAYRWDNLSNYTYLVGSDASSRGAYTNAKNTNFSSIGALTCSYSKAIDYFVFGGSDKWLTFFNGTNNNNTAVQWQYLNASVQDSDFSNDGLFLAVGVGDGNVYIYTQNCKGCGQASFYNITAKTCQLCTTILQGCISCTSNQKCNLCFQTYFLNPINNTCSSCFQALVGCSTCSDSLNCTTTVLGYYLNGSTPILCKSVFPHCEICNSSTCIQCHSPYFFDNNSGVCQLCSNYISHCLQCLNQTYCYQCSIGFYLKLISNTQQKCDNCWVNCIDCLNSSTCLTCAIGYYVNLGGQCSPCADGCLICNSLTFCIDCMVGMYKQDNSCNSCIPPCQTCQSDTHCITCLLGYYINGSDCLPCFPRCFTCSATQCLTCQDGHYLSNGICTVCTQKYNNCQSCTNTTCNLCYGGFYKNTQNTCQPCSMMIYGCVMCNSSTCLYCAVSYYLDTYNLCKPCKFGCSTCDRISNCTTCVPGYYHIGQNCSLCANPCATCDGNPNNCSSCVVGYYLQSIDIGNCIPCNDIISNCIQCINITQSILTCTQCQLSYYLTPLNQCNPCNPTCTSCKTTPTICLSCILGFYLNTINSSCLPCTPSCLSCITQAICSSCQTGYYLSGTICRICPVPCLTCDDTGKCLSCIVGYTFIMSNHTCQICSSFVPNCLLCNQPSLCSECVYGYVLSNTNDTCTSCSTINGCVSCRTLIECMNCQSGYYNSDGKCQSCTQGCIVCQNFENCLLCAPFYFSTTISNTSTNMQCLRCVNYLLGCQSCTNKTDCTSCQSGYYHMTNSLGNQICTMCQITLPSCDVCFNSSSCKNCKGGYFLQNSTLTCRSCNYLLIGCQLCNPWGTVCTNCESGYYLDGNNCTLCRTNLRACEICNGSTLCLQCTSGYYLQSYQCHLCSNILQGCTYCQSPTICLTCNSGYYLNQSICHPCQITGCSVCLPTNPSQCLICNSLYYKLSPTNICLFCNESIPGCLSCKNINLCSKCDVGYYLLSPTNSSCRLCTETIKGCSICSSPTICLQCQSTFYLLANQCQLCSNTLPGCIFCTNSSSCLVCGAGFFLSQLTTPPSCSPCTDITGCLLCTNSSTCLFCKTGYYLSTKQCLPCSMIQNCYSCKSASVCTSCLGGYTLNTNFGCDVTVVHSRSSQSIAHLIMLKTLYLNSQSLMHYLYALDTPFTKTTMNWSSNAKLWIIGYNGSQIYLTITSVQWENTNDYTLIFYTDNPINQQLTIRQMPFKSRILASSIDISTLKTKIQLSESASQMIFPQSQSNGSLTIQYPLINPQFYKSYTKKQSPKIPFYLFGVAISSLLFLIYLIKALITVPNSPNIGNIIPHIFAFKVGALLLYPTYLEYTNYCIGFMYVDFPFFNDYFSSIFSDPRDYSPHPYTFFYTNMNFASMYLFALCIIIFLTVTGIAISRCCTQQHQIKTNAYFTFLYNIFAFGAIFASCASLQGAILNPISSINFNGIWYIVGSLLYFIILSQCIYKLTHNTVLNFWKIRVILKATLLSLSHFGPIYMLSSAILIDLVLSTIEYHLSDYPKQFHKSWITANIMVNLALLLLIFVPTMLLSLAVVSFSIVIAIFAEIAMHFMETRVDNATYQKTSDKSDKQLPNQKPNDNIWNVDDTSQQNVINLKSGRTSKINPINDQIFQSTIYKSQNSSNAEILNNSDFNINNIDCLTNNKYGKSTISKHLFEKQVANQLNISDCFEIDEIDYHRDSKNRMRRTEKIDKNQESFVISDVFNGKS